MRDWGFLSSCFYIEDMEVDFVISLDIVKEEFWKMDLLDWQEKYICNSDPWTIKWKLLSILF